MNSGVYTKVCEEDFSKPLFGRRLLSQHFAAVGVNVVTSGRITVASL